MNQNEPEVIRWQGKFITAKQRGRWEYASRSRGIRAAAILAIDDGHVILVEQYRVPLGRPCLEIPAGLVGDDILAVRQTISSVVIYFGRSKRRSIKPQSITPDKVDFPVEDGVGPWVAFAETLFQRAAVGKF